jgi:hypothetical protein
MAILVMIIILLINSCVFYLFRDKEEQGRWKQKKF